jgi:PIN domain nuclease of toxin-antitoxin system
MNIIIDTHIFLWALSDVAQSLAENFPLMTEDPKIAMYDCHVI